MKVEVLISCMYQKDLSIAYRSALTGSGVIINQCDTDGYMQTADGKVRMKMTTQRGLSRSRNMAIELSDADLCLISDDDEFYATNYEEILCQSYESHPKADVILFKVGNSGKTYSETEYKVGYIEALKFASWQISFRRNKVVQAGIWFDEKMGSGTGNGSGEEIKFLFDCLRHGLHLQYVPIEIASLDPGSSSQWFHGFTDEYFVNRGWATARYMGKPLALIYAVYFALRKYPLYRKDNNPLVALCCLTKGVFQKR